MALARDLTVVRDLLADLHARGQDEQARALKVVLDLAASAMTDQPAPIQPREYLTTSRAAASLGVSRQTIKNWVQAGRLRGVVLGGRMLIHRAEVQAQLDRLLSARPQASLSQADPEAARTGYLAAVRAVPAEALQRLEVLHQRLEGGRHLSAAERHEMIALEREVTRSATDALARQSRRRPGVGR